MSPFPELATMCGVGRSAVSFGGRSEMGDWAM